MNICATRPFKGNNNNCIPIGEGISDNNNNTVKAFTVVVVVTIMVINAVAISVIAAVHSQNKLGFLEIEKN